MWEMITREFNGRHYHIEFLREFSTYDRHIDGAWIAILKIKRNKEIVFHYEYGFIRFVIKKNISVLAAHIAERVDG